jgi:hypothetical protein
MGEMRNVYKILVGKPRGRWEDNMGLEEIVGQRGLDSLGSRHGQIAALCEHCNESLDSIKGGELLD